MIPNTRIAFSTSSQRTLNLMRTIITRRNQGTSTMGTITSQKGPYGDHHANAHHNINRDLSTAVEFGGRINVNSFALNQIMSASHNFAQVQDMHVFGKELTIKEAAMAAKSGQSKDVFDKIVLLVPHGETSCVTKDEARSTFGDKVQGDIALTQKVRLDMIVSFYDIKVHDNKYSIPSLFSHFFSAYYRESDKHSRYPVKQENTAAQSQD